MEREEMDIESSSTKAKLLIEFVTEEILKAAWRKTEFDCQDETYE